MKLELTCSSCTHFVGAVEVIEATADIANAVLEKPIEEFSGLSGARGAKQARQSLDLIATNIGDLREKFGREAIEYLRDALKGIAKVGEQYPALTWRLK